MKMEWTPNESDGVTATLEMVSVARVTNARMAAALERLLGLAGVTVETEERGEMTILAVPAEFSDLAKTILAKKRRDLEDEDELDDEDDDLDDEDEDDLDDEEDEDDFDDDDEEEFEEEFDEDELDDDDDIFYDEDEDE